MLLKGRAKKEPLLKFHKDVWMPDRVYDAALAFMPKPGLPLRIGRHYRQQASKRVLPLKLKMPVEFDIIDVVMYNEFYPKVYRAMIRFHRTAHRDFVLVLDDKEVVTGFWINRNDNHDTLDRSVYQNR